MTLPGNPTSSGEIPEQDIDRPSVVTTLAVSPDAR
jgi:hypothetical protein